MVECNAIIRTGETMNSKPIVYAMGLTFVVLMAYKFGSIFHLLLTVFLSTPHVQANSQLEHCTI